MELTLMQIWCGTEFAAIHKFFFHLLRVKVKSTIEYHNCMALAL